MTIFASIMVHTYYYAIWTFVLILMFFILF